MNAPNGINYVLRQIAGSRGEYEINANNFKYPFKANTYYRYSMWVAITSDFNGSLQTHHTRYFTTLGGNYVTENNSAIASTQTIDGLKWELKTLIIKTQPTANGEIDLYVGYPTYGTTGSRYITDIRLEEVYK